MKVVTMTMLSAALLIAGAIILAPQKAQANPKFAADTKKACNFCHTAPPTLNEQGQKFKANGNKL
jgi:hypothetical protein